MGDSWLFFKPHFSLQEGAISPVIEVQSATESIDLERGEVSPATHDAHVLLAVIGILSSLLLMVQAPLLCDCVSPLYRKFSMCTVIFPILIVDILHLFLENHYFSFFPLALALVVESRKALFCTSGCTYGTAGVQIFASSWWIPIKSSIFASRPVQALIFWGHSRLARPCSKPHFRRHSVPIRMYSRRDGKGLHSH